MARKSHSSHRESERKNVWWNLVEVVVRDSEGKCETVLPVLRVSTADHSLVQWQAPLGKGRVWCFCFGTFGKGTVVFKPRLCFLVLQNGSVLPLSNTLLVEDCADEGIYIAV